MAHGGRGLHWICLSSSGLSLHSTCWAAVTSFILGSQGRHRQRCNNIRMVGLPVGAEGPKPAVFVEAFFKQLFDMHLTYVVERAHRVLTGTRPPGAPPCPFLVRLLNFRNRTWFLKKPGNARSFPLKRVMLFPVFSAKTQKHRRSFMEVHQCLREQNISYSKFYPSRLHVLNHGWLNFYSFFYTLLEASDWLDALWESIAFELSPVALQEMFCTSSLVSLWLFCSRPNFNALPAYSVMNLSWLWLACHCMADTSSFLLLCDTRRMGSWMYTDSNVDIILHAPTLW